MPWNEPSQRFDRRMTSPAFAGALAVIGWTRIVSKTRVKYSVESQKAILKNTLRTTDAEKTGSRAVI
jgi:hypothetical protein